MVHNGKISEQNYTYAYERITHCNYESVYLRLCEIFNWQRTLHVTLNIPPYKFQQ